MRLPLFFRRFCSRMGLGLAMGLTLGCLPAMAQASNQRSMVFDLNQAVCANDWDRAIDMAGILIASDTTNSEDRQALLSLRRQMVQYRAEGTLASDAQACNHTDPYMLTAAAPETLQTAEPLGWEAAVAEVTENQYSTELITESPQLTLPVNMSTQPGLTPAEPVDLSRGLTVVPGHVGPGHQTYGFVAGMGDRLDINLEVTRVMTGSLYTSDDSQLFIFDRDGRLLVSTDDDGGSQQSRISNWVVPRTDLYFAVVTSYNNDPIFNQQGRVTGWQENGGGRFDYTLGISGATPTSALVR
ncbi:MAG: hypothetical protein AAFY72_01370 [Cyanobacteria bacterium J06649_4]